MTDLVGISEFYRGKHVFITGGTGFIGKVLIEKLLRSCPGIAGIHCLVRPKRGKGVQERLEAILEQPMFEPLKQDQPDFKKKLHAISGDVIEPELGISEYDMTFLEKNISVVFHSAATINFNEKMRLALELNLVGVQKMLNLARKMSKLEVFLHVSTAYANCDRSYIDEKVYPPAVRPEKILDMLSWAPDDVLDTLTPYMIAQKPNTYTYTKQLAETLLIEEGQGLPLVILRPSIVTASMKEPLPGWIDNYNGPSGLYIAYGKGLLRTMYGDKAAIADVIPVDIVVNSMIAVSWSTAITKSESVKVYQVTSGDLNPITWDYMEQECSANYKEYPMDGTIGTPIKVLTRSRVVHITRTWLCHWMPAYLMDFAATLIGGKPRLVRLYDKLHKGVGVLTFFTNRTWSWNNSNLLELNDALLPADRAAFYLDPREIDWKSYIYDYCMGVKVFVMKEKMSDIDKARTTLRRIQWFDRLFRLAFLVAAWKWGSKSRTLRHFWFMFFSFITQLFQKLRLTY